MSREMFYQLRSVFGEAEGFDEKKHSEYFDRQEAGDPEMEGKSCPFLHDQGMNEARPVEDEAEMDGCPSGESDISTWRDRYIRTEKETERDLDADPGLDVEVEPAMAGPEAAPAGAGVVFERMQEARAEFDATMDELRKQFETPSALSPRDAAASADEMVSQFPVEPVDMPFDALG